MLSATNFDFCVRCATFDLSTDMASTLETVAQTSPQAGPAPGDLAAIPWYVWSLFGAVVSVVIGGYWDISWHMSIGRDTFWTPAHMAIQFCGILAGCTCGYLILSCTRSEEHTS